MIVKYFKKNMTSKEDTIQNLSIIISKLEIKAINKLIDEIELPKILEKFLSKKDQNIYYRSKYKLKELLNK